MGFIGGYSEEAYDKPLHDYQSFGAQWMLDRLYAQRELGAALFLDPGLGKTRTTLTLLDILFELGEIKKALILAPLRPVYTVWPAEIERWGFPQSHIILHKQHVRALGYDMQIELCNYEGLPKLSEIKNRWDIIVLDESTFIKNWSAKRSKYIRKMIKTIPRRLCLSGTPAANSLGDLHSQMYVVDDGDALGRTVGRFRDRFCIQGGWRGRKWAVRDSVQTALQEAIQDKVLRMQAEDYLDMPELVENDIWVKMSESASKQYRRLERELYAELKTGSVLCGSAAAAYTKCRQYANGQVYSLVEGSEDEKVVHHAHGEKIAALFELHEELAGKPLLIFYSYKHDLERIRTAKGSPFKKTPVMGETKTSESDKLVKEWNAGEHHALLCQWQGGSHGLNMQEACNDIACFGVTDSLEGYEQAFRRVYRQGVQGKQVRIHRIFTLNTVDEVMLERLKGKHETQADFLEALKKHAKG